MFVVCNISLYESCFYMCVICENIIKIQIQIQIEIL
jgi:hypothetical protein